MTITIQDILNGAETALRDLIADGTESLREHLRRTITDGVAAAQLPPERRDPLLKELAGQIRLAVEIGRLKAINRGWEIAVGIVLGFLQLLI